MSRKPTTLHLEQRIRELMLIGFHEIHDIWHQLQEEGDTTINNHVTLWRTMRRVEQQLLDDGYSFGWYKRLK